MTTVADFDTCPCGDGNAFSNCCKPLHTAGFAGLGATAEATMRSRYVAYVLHDEDYLLATWHSSTRPTTLDFSDDVEWHGLTVEATADGLGFDSIGTVEFRARFRRGDAHLELHELSSFVRENGRWFYVDGVDPDS
jgi:SEC-C motif-containing protein